MVRFNFVGVNLCCCTLASVLHNSNMVDDNDAADGVNVVDDLRARNEAFTNILQSISTILSFNINATDSTNYDGLTDAVQTLRDRVTNIEQERDRVTQVCLFSF
jgi:hypothetical protein